MKRYTAKPTKRERRIMARKIRRGKIIRITRTTPVTLQP